MRQNLLLALAMCGAMGVYAQTDMTRCIINPSFENGSDGWTNVGMALQNNSTFALKHGNVYAEKWVPKGNYAGDASLTQTITGLPAGTYTLTAQAQNIQQDSPNAVQTGVSLIAGSQSTPVEVTGKYSVTTTVDKTGELSIAFQLKGATGNYICVDDFRLTFDACSLEQIAAMLATALELADKKMNGKLQSDLAAAIAAAEALTSEDGATDAAAALYDCVAEAQTSIAEYAALLSALDEAKDFYATAPANGADELKAAIDQAQSLYDAAEATTTAATVQALAGALISCRVANSTGKAPTVTSEHFMPVGCAAALGRMTATGTGIIERGYVWATHPNPTVADNRSTLKYSNNGDIYELSPLEPATCYYVRAYAMTKGYAVGYGEEQRIYTLPKASCRWSYDEASPESDANDRIRNAVRDACEFYNKWTSIPGFHLNAHYVYGAGAGGGTADCSYGGYMRVSQSVSYQRTGTLLHESNHGVGVGTSDRWLNWDGSGLRANNDRGQWLGWRATQMVRFFEHNETAILNGDNTHMWPYGINGAHEDDNRQILYIANTLITHAVHQDGLAAVWGIGASPAYTFEHQDDAKYYITSSSAAHGAGTAFLYETVTGALKWGEANDEALKADDSYAWYFEFVPAKAYYRIRNAKSGKYFTYSGSSIKTASRPTPGASENFQLMVAFKEVTVGEDKTVTKRPYSIQAGTGDFTPYVLKANAKGATAGVELNLNAADKDFAAQNWMILTESEAMDISSARLDVHTDRLQQLIAGTKAMMNVPHTDHTEGATQAMATAADEMQAKIPAIASIKDAKSEIKAFKKNIRDYVEAAYPDDIMQPYDLTFLIEDPAFATTDYWDANSQAQPTVADGVACVEDARFKFSQTLDDMPKGTYTLKAQAYQTVEPTSVLYINSTVYKATVEYMGGDEDTAASAMASGMYDNQVVCRTSKRADLTVGITNTKSQDTGKTVFSNFRLYYYGNDFSKTDVEQATAVSGVEPGGTIVAGIYSINGTRLDKPARGLNIIKTEDGRVMKIILK